MKQVGSPEEVLKQPVSQMIWTMFCACACVCKSKSMAKLPAVSLPKSRLACALSGSLRRRRRHTLKGT